jgi:hypothetical protein
MSAELTAPLLSLYRYIGSVGKLVKRGDEGEKISLDEAISIILRSKALVSISTTSWQSQLMCKPTITQAQYEVFQKAYDFSNAHRRAVGVLMRLSIRFTNADSVPAQCEELLVLNEQKKSKSRAR